MWSIASGGQGDCLSCPAIIAKLEEIVVLASAIGLLSLADWAKECLSGLAVLTIATHGSFADLGQDELPGVPKWSVKHRNLLWLLVVGFGQFFLAYFREGQENSV